MTLDPREPSPEDPSSGFGQAFPEGGCQAWTCLLGSCLLMFPSFGFQAAVGAVQDCISLHQLSGYSVRDVGWIIAILVFLTLSLRVQPPAFTSYILLAECTKYWHFILCLSILGGVSAAVNTMVAIAVLSQWFHRRRALASGLCMAGSSAGGAVITLILQTIFPCYGVILVRGRLPAGNRTASRATIDMGAFHSPRLCFLTAAVFAFEFIMFGCAALLPTYVRFSGISTNVQLYSLTALNSMSLLGRVLPGFAADQVGLFNVLLCLVVVTLVVMAAVWLPFGSRDVAIFGFGSGGWLSLAPVCAGQLCRTEEYGRFYGTVYFVAAFGVLLTVPGGVELLQATTPQVLVGFYAAVLLVGLVALTLSRWAVLD
ncbi:MFS general substrate transporter [Aspergillus homomorphus CBS 101889]|uniref:MFS general substrate transporter n=1 Tax=Aspergillus homomorphus (strain CBS 101889) TaxID=1450537 RepID=A0A395HNR9_ASPHC|nr:MFS general substrate transporter [Aspergillus homomorphus CBS 101889]RAL09602.1 MFS general substrate transporter [Aspergillus homomorphus CBS 101889]